MSAIGTREGCLRALAGTGGRESVSAAAVARAGNAGREASGCENCLLSSHPPPRSGRNLTLLVSYVRWCFSSYFLPYSAQIRY